MIRIYRILCAFGVHIVYRPCSKQLNIADQCDCGRKIRWWFER